MSVSIIITFPILENAKAILRAIVVFPSPAGVGVIAHIDTFGRNGIALVVALMVSTTLAILAAALAFRGVARLTGAEADE